jgi:hypothetical protein
VSRAVALAQYLRTLKDERDEVAEKKAIHDHDANRAVNALLRFHLVVEKESKPDSRLSTGSEDQDKQQGETPPASESEPDAVKEEESPNVPPWAKKAFRAIALRTHPDKVNADQSFTDSQRDRLVALYSEASSAFHAGRYETLAEIAAELDIEIDISASDMESALERKIASLRSDISGMQKTLSWHWGISFGDLLKRVLVLKGCCKVMGIPTPDDSVLEEIVRELESQPDFDIVDRLGRVRRIKSGVERRKTGTRPVKRIR